jgi:putative metalloprotease
MPAGKANAEISENQAKEAWQDVCAAAEIKPLPFSIKDDKVANAWVTAGESVTVTTGLMKIMDRYEDIFGVLSHEAGHAVLKHYEKKTGNAVEVGLVSYALGKMIGKKNITKLAIGAGATLATAGYSREQEIAADDYAVDLALKAGRDPTGIYSALERLSIFGSKTEPSGFNSHPPDDRRLKHVKERILSKSPDAVFPEVKKEAD